MNNFLTFYTFSNSGLALAIFGRPLLAAFCFFLAWAAL